MSLPPRAAIRRFRPGDQRAVERLVLGIQQDEYGLALSAANQPDLQDVAAFFGSGASAFWVAVAQDHSAGPAEVAPDLSVVGCIGLEDAGDGVAVMRKFMVAPAWRGRRSGLAGALLAVFEAHAAASGLHRVALSTVASTLAAQAFYEKSGYQRVAREQLPAAHVPGVLDTVFFLRTLAPPDGV
jgi:N-acetylglutamate synthase-like GNAT family acetyltransferase